MLGPKPVSLNDRVPSSGLPSASIRIQSDGANVATVARIFASLGRDLRVEEILALQRSSPAQTDASSQTTRHQGLPKVVSSGDSMRPLAQRRPEPSDRMLASDDRPQNPAIAGHSTRLSLITESSCTFIWVSVFSMCNDAARAAIPSDACTDATGESVSVQRSFGG